MQCKCDQPVNINHQLRSLTCIHLLLPQQREADRQLLGWQQQAATRSGSATSACRRRRGSLAAWDRLERHGRQAAVGKTQTGPAEDVDGTVAAQCGRHIRCQRNTAGWLRCGGTGSVHRPARCRRARFEPADPPFACIGTCGLAGGHHAQDGAGEALRQGGVADPQRPAQGRHLQRREASILWLFQAGHRGRLHSGSAVGRCARLARPAAR